MSSNESIYEPSNKCSVEVSPVISTFGDDPKLERGFAQIMRKILVLACAAIFLFAAVHPAIGAFGPPAADNSASLDDGMLRSLSAVAGAGMMQTNTYENLRELSDDIGGRVTGSPEAARAIAWGLDKMKAAGLENVRAETWQLSRGWTRISARAEIVAPIHRSLMIDSLGWVGSTPAGGAEADVMAVNSYQLDAQMKDTSGWKGKILLVVHVGEPPADRMAGFAKFGNFLKTAHTAGALAVIGGQGGGVAQGMHLTHTGALGFDTYYDIPVVSMAAEDQEQLERYIERGKTVRLKIDVQNRVTDGHVESANVVGEIPGTEHPEQIILVGGHLDSWDLASGATDNGFGAVAALGAAEAIIKSGQKPLRTIRFVLFTGEEQGLLGSVAYVKAHQSEMPSHIAAVVLDNGQGPVVGLQLGGRADLIPAVKKLTTALQAFGNLKVDDEVEFGTDTGPFILAGLPGINLDQDSPEYKYTHHSAVDTFDKVQADILDRDATVMALTAFWIADRHERLASPWPQEKTAQMLVDKHQDLVLKLFGLWPFGNLGTAQQ